MYIFFKFLVLSNDMYNVFRGEADTNRAKNNEVLLYNLFTQTHHRVWKMKKLHHKFTIKKFLKNESSKDLCLPNASEF